MSLAKSKRSQMLLLTIILKFSKMISLINNSFHSKFTMIQEHFLIKASLNLIQNHSSYQEKILSSWSQRTLTVRSTKKQIWDLKYLQVKKILVILFFHTKIQKMIQSIIKKIINKCLKFRLTDNHHVKIVYSKKQAKDLKGENQLLLQHMCTIKIIRA